MTRQLGDLPATGRFEGHVLILPFGAFEQHGPHLPHATDGHLASAIARAAGERCEEVPVLVGPTLAYGVSAHHVGLGVTLSIAPATLLAVVGDLLESLRGVGLAACLLLNAHGGNSGLLRSAANEEVARGGVMCAVADYWDLAADEIRSLRRSGRGGLGHAGELETSLVMHLLGDLVAGDASDNLGRDTAGLEDDMLDPAALFVPARMASEFSAGVLGAPSQASADHGAELFEVIVAAVVRAVETLHRHATGGHQ